jgi:DNA-binding NarL/FixJ family response regulator
MTRLHGFTTREAAVAGQREADELAMTENTVRTHTRHVFGKARVERLTDLVLFLLRGAGRPRTLGLVAQILTGRTHQFW